MIRTKFFLNNRIKNLLLCPKVKMSFSQDLAKSRKRYLFERAAASKSVIEYILSLPPMTGQPHKTTYDQNIYEQLNNNTLSTLIIQKLRNRTFIISKGQKQNLSDEVIKQFEKMFDPKAGVLLPSHLNAQKRINDGMNVSKIQNKSNISASGSNLTDYSKSQQEGEAKLFSFFPNRLSTVQIFKILKNFQHKTLSYGPPGIAKTTSIIFYCYLTSMITQYEFEYDHRIAPSIPRIFYLSYQQVGGETVRQEKNLKNHQNRLIKHTNQMIISQCPQKLRNKLTNSAQIGIDQLYKNYDKIKYAFEDHKISLKVVLDQFNSFVAELRNFNSSVSDSKEQLSEQKKLQRQKLVQKYIFWIQMPRNLAEDSLLYNSSQKIEQNILDQAQNGNYFGLNLNHHSNITIHSIDFYNKLSSVEGKKEILRALFFGLKKCGKIQLQEQINEIQKVYFSNDNSFFENECNISMTHQIIRKFFTQIISANEVDIILQKIKDIANNPRKQQKRRSINMLINQIIIQIENKLRVQFS